MRNKMGHSEPAETQTFPIFPLTRLFCFYFIRLLSKFKMLFSWPIFLVFPSKTRMVSASMVFCSPKLWTYLPHPPKKYFVRMDPERQKGSDWIPYQMSRPMTEEPKLPVHWPFAESSAFAFSQICLVWMTLLPLPTSCGLVLFPLVWSITFTTL